MVVRRLRHSTIQNSNKNGTLYKTNFPVFRIYDAVSEVIIIISFKIFALLLWLKFLRERKPLPLVTKATGEALGRNRTIVMNYRPLSSVERARSEFATWFWRWVWTRPHHAPENAYWVVSIANKCDRNFI